MSQPFPEITNGAAPTNSRPRRVVLVTSPGAEPTLADVVINLATVCAEVGQSVVIVGTEGLAAPSDDSALPLSTTLTWQQWPSPGIGRRSRLLSGPVSPADVKDLLGETGVPGVSRLDLRYFVGHPAQVVVRAPEVLVALEQLVDVVILEVPSYLSVHHGEGLTPLADVVLMVGERQTTSLKQVRGTSAALRRLGAPVVGMALTRDRGRTYHWGRDSEFDSEDEQLDEVPLDEVRDPTEEVPITESKAIVPASTLDSGHLTDDPAPEA